MTDFTIQRGTSTILTANSTIVITAGTDYTAPAALANAFIRITSVNAMGCETSAASLSPDSISADISNPANLLTSITFTRTTVGTTGLHIDWEIVEYIGAPGGANEFIVRQQEELSYGSAANTVNGTATTPVSDAKIAVFLTGQRLVTAGATMPDLLSYALWDATNHWATFTRNRSTTTVTNLSYAAIEFTGTNWSVQYLTHTFTTPGVKETASITDVGSLTQAFVHSQHIEQSGDTNNYEYTAQCWLDTTSTVAFQLDSQATVTNHIVAAWVIANSQTGIGASNCNRYTGTYTTSGTTNVSITTVANLAQSSVVEITQTNTQNTPSSGRDGASHKLTTTANCAIFHTGTVGTSTYRFAVFEWPTAATILGTIGSPIIAGGLSTMIISSTGQNNIKLVRL